MMKNTLFRHITFWIEKSLIQRFDLLWRHNPKYSDCKNRTEALRKLIAQEVSLNNNQKGEDK